MLMKPDETNETLAIDLTPSEKSDNVSEVLHGTSYSHSYEKFVLRIRYAISESVLNTAF